MGKAPDIKFLSMMGYPISILTLLIADTGKTQK